jgi:hypothetical protein
LLTPLRILQMRGAFIADFTSEKQWKTIKKSLFGNWPLMSIFFTAHLSSLRNTSFNKDLSNEPNFGLIHLAGQYL